MTASGALRTALEARYRIEREIGSGGMATVYLARDLKHDREVALKVLRPELGAVLGSERFLSEVRISARLDHPHILTLIDSGESAGFLWYVLPFVRGESLRAKLEREKQLSLDEALDITRQIASALDYAHQKGVVHRDIKPENILLHEGEAMLADFGIALAVKEAGGNRLTETGLSLGTPQYMSPEQATGDRALDARSDVYSLGAVLYEMLAGEPPVTGPTVQAVIAKLLTERPTHLRVVRDTVPEGVDAAVAKALSKVPADRFASAAEFSRALTGSRRSGAGRVAAAPKWAVPAAALLLAPIAFAVWKLASSSSAAPVALERMMLTTSGNARWPSLSPDGRRFAYATRQCDAGGQCTQSLVVQDVGGAGAATIVTGLGGLWDIDWTRDGRYLVFDGSFGSARWGAFSVPSLGGSPRHLGCCSASMVPGTDTALIVAPRAAGNPRLAVRTVTVADGIVHDSVEIVGSAAGNTYLGIMEDGRRLIAFNNEATGLKMRYLRRDGTIMDSLLVTAAGTPFGISLDPDGRYVLVGVPRRSRLDEVDIVRYGLTAGGFRGGADTVLRQLQVTDGVSVGDDGQMIGAAGPIEFSLWAMDRQSPTGPAMRTQTRLASGTAQISGSISHDGSRVLVVRTILRGDQRLQQLALVPFGGGTETPLGPPFEGLEDWDWALDDRSVLLGLRRGERVHISEIDVAPGRFRERHSMDVAAYQSLETLPGGGFVVLSRTGRQLYRIGVRGLADTVFQLGEEAGLPGQGVPSRDGASLATLGWDESFDSVAVQEISLRDGSVRRLAAFSGEGYDMISRLPDGSLQFGVLETEGTLVWYRLAPGDRPARMGPVPRYPASYRMSDDGRRVLARVGDPRPDIFLIRNFGQLLGRD